MLSITTIDMDKALHILIQDIILVHVYHFSISRSQHQLIVGRQTFITSLFEYVIQLIKGKYIHLNGG